MNDLVRTVPAFLLALSAMGCSSLATPSERRPNTLDASPKLGIAMVPSPDSPNAIPVLSALPVAETRAPETDTPAAWLPRKGDWEATLSGSGANDHCFNNGNAAIGGSIGYYLDDCWLLGLRHDMSYANSGPESWDGISRIALDAHLTKSRIRPYVGANVGFAYGDSVKESIELAPEAGIKFYVKDKVFLGFHAEYEFYLDRYENFSADFSHGSFVYSLGFGIAF